MHASLRAQMCFLLPLLSPHLQATCSCMGLHRPSHCPPAPGSSMQVLGYRPQGLGEPLGQLRSSAECLSVCKSGMLLVPPLLQTGPTGLGIGDRDVLLGLCPQCGAECWDRAWLAAALLHGLGSIAAFAHTVDSTVGCLPAAHTSPQWAFRRRNLSDVFQELLADRSLIICFKR